MHQSLGQRVRFLIALAILVAIGVVCAGYVLVNARAPVPFRDTYEVDAELSAADGVAPGLGQPVRVAGVKVGTITDARYSRGHALVTLEIEREQVPRVYSDARATLDPVTPLKDMQLLLDPGRPPARPLPEGGRIGIARTATPVPLSDLLSALDGDTRDFLGSLIASLDQGTRGRADDLRKALATLGPTTAQVGRITGSLRKRRSAIRRLVHNLSEVTREASDSGQLAELVQGGNQTLEAIARQDAPLRETIARLPGTLSTTRSALTSAASFSERLRPALAELQPGVQRLPATLASLKPFAQEASTMLQRRLRPLVRDAKPLVRTLGPGVRDLSAASPDLVSSFQSINYLLNELAYNPPGDDEGFLFWTSWFFHNWNSVFGTADAHGGIGRATVFADCQQLTGLIPIDTVLKAALGVGAACGKDG